MITAEELKGYTSEQLDEAYQLVLLEREERWKKENLPKQIEDAITQLQEVEGTRHEPEGQWQEPAGVHDAYLSGDITTYQGKLWESLVTPNVWEPGVSGWREVVEEGAAPAEYVPPTGSHDTYGQGDLVTFEGAVYESLIDNNSWSPRDYPGGWRLVSQADTQPVTA